MRWVGDNIKVNRWGICIDESHCNLRSIPAAGREVCGGRDEGVGVRNSQAACEAKVADPAAAREHPAERAPGNGEAPEATSPTEIGQMLRQRREAQGLNRPQAAAIAGVSVFTLREHERGRGLDAVAGLIAYLEDIGVRVSFRTVRRVVTQAPPERRQSAGSPSR